MFCSRGGGAGWGGAGRNTSTRPAGVFSGVTSSAELARTLRALRARAGSPDGWARGPRAGPVSDDGAGPGSGLTSEDRTSREALLDAARHEFATAGFTRSSPDGIARAAGVTDGAPIHYVPNRAALVQAVLERRFSAASSRTRSRVPGHRSQALARRSRRPLRATTTVDPSCPATARGSGR
ncbi:TetR/AcrR family transcriptional regulator [Kineococcus sp. LSe6-4]|uniref:TetR/AcrR family transcriptional regulator n=1 Tax=Kineococcus halophytocola TaxID=3234027 RepID=A0ABV4GWN4_9ACTN